jgi:hypothetical protein
MAGRTSFENLQVYKLGEELAPKLNAYLQSIGNIPEAIRVDENGEGATDH